MLRARFLRLVAAVTMAIGVLVVPVSTVMACDCAMTELPQAIRDADLAIVGTLLGEAPEPGVARPDDMPLEIEWTWQVERASEPVDGGLVTLVAWPDDGANCGVQFGVGERWLVLGHLEDGRLLTNGCMRNQRLDGTDPDGEAVIAELLPESAASSASGPAQEAAVPLPVILVGAAALLMGVIGLFAFRPGDRG